MVSRYLRSCTSPGGIDAAGGIFTVWGQHNSIEIPKRWAGILGLWSLIMVTIVHADESLLPLDNFSRVVRFKINLNTMTVTRPCMEYGKTEVGDGAIAFVSAKHLLTNGHGYSLRRDDG